MYILRIYIYATTNNCTLTFWSSILPARCIHVYTCIIYIYILYRVINYITHTKTRRYNISYDRITPTRFNVYMYMYITRVFCIGLYLTCGINRGIYTIYYCIIYRRAISETLLRFSIVIRIIRIYRYNLYYYIITR